VTGDPILQLDNVESGYGPVRAVRGVSLVAERGRIVVVLGSNGAGKTSLLKTISGIIDPTGGRIRLNGDDIGGAEPADIVGRGLSHVPEGREMFPLLSVQDNLRMGAYLRRDRDGAARDLETVYGYFPVLRERKGQPAGLLSGGQQQMLAISRALMAAPEVILLDEPSLGLSPKLTREIFEIITRINRERGVTMLLVEQNARMGLNAADHGYIMENGVIVADASCETLRARADIQRFYLGAASQDGARPPRRRSVWA
jgi:branched-chain amino acid transport system ATP-binding protein